MDEIRMIPTADGLFDIEITSSSQIIYIRPRKEEIEVDIFEKDNEHDTVGNDKFHTWEDVMEFIQGMSLIPPMEKWDERCPECDSKHIDYDSQPGDDTVHLTCTDCDTTFDAILETIYWLQKDTIEKGENDGDDECPSQDQNKA